MIDKVKVGMVVDIRGTIAFIEDHCNYRLVGLEIAKGDIVEFFIENLKKAATLVPAAEKPPEPAKEEEEITGPFYILQDGGMHRKDLPIAQMKMGFLGKIIYKATLDNPENITFEKIGRIVMVTCPICGKLKPKFVRKENL
jgi:predicted type IV restriction endonuclease